MIYGHEVDDSKDVLRHFTECPNHLNYDAPVLSVCTKSQFKRPLRTRRSAKLGIEFSGTV